MIFNIVRRFSESHQGYWLPLKTLGFEVHCAANFGEYKGSMDDVPFITHQVDFARNPFNPVNGRAFLQLVSLMKSNQFTLIHCNSPVGGLLGRLASFITDTSPVLYTAHGFHFYEGAPRINNMLYRRVERLLGHITDGIITINSEDLESAKAFVLRNSGSTYFLPGVGVSTKKYRNVTINVNELRSKLGLPINGKVIIMVGELIDRKNYQNALKAIARIHRKDVNCIICGTGPLEKKLKRLAQDLGIEQRVRFLGFRTDIAELLQASDLFLFTTYQEGLPRALMEAMAAGLPVVASNVRGNTDLIVNGEGGFLVAPNDVEGTANALVRVLSEQILRKQMSDVNLRHIQDFDVEVVNEQMLGIYKDVLSRSPGKKASIICSS